MALLRCGAAWRCGAVFARARGLCATSFGFQPVTEEDKARKVEEVFQKVAGYYDQMNDVMSFGLHRLWKDWFVRQLAPPPGARILDVAGGTGDVALRMAAYTGPGGEERGGGERGGVGESGGGERGGVKVTVLDISSEMLQEGMKKPGSEGISWVHGDAMALPFPDNSFDSCTIVFGIRNVPNISKVLREAKRVLVAGGRFMCMEFCPVENPLLKRLYDGYSFEVIPVLGELVAGDRLSYQYLVESIRQFPTPDAFASMLKEAGLKHIHYQTLSFGIAAVHSGFKSFQLKK